MLFFERRREKKTNVNVQKKTKTIYIKDQNNDESERHKKNMLQNKRDNHFYGELDVNNEDIEFSIDRKTYFPGNNNNNNNYNYQNNKY